jgi:hypothetical protein
MVVASINIRHPPSSPDLATNDLFLFLMIKKILKGRHVDGIRSHMTTDLKTIPQNEFQNCFEGCTGISA